MTDLKTLGFQDADVRSIEAMLHNNKDEKRLCLISGLSGSGKSTTIKAILEHELTINPKLKILTVERNPELAILGVSQIPVLEPSRYGDTIRTALRLDPDILMVGEIRDSDTALAVLHAVATGHIVLTSIQARSADDALDKMADLSGKTTDYVNTLTSGLIHQELPLADGKFVLRAQVVDLSYPPEYEIRGHTSIPVQGFDEVTDTCITSDSLFELLRLNPETLIIGEIRTTKKTRKYLSDSHNHVPQVTSEIHLSNASSKDSSGAVEFSDEYSIRQRTLVKAPSSLVKIGFTTDQANEILTALTVHSHVDIILVAGRIGSGKTTTVATLLNEYLGMFPSSYVKTFESPIEYLIRGADQEEYTCRDSQSVLKTVLGIREGIVMLDELLDINYLNNLIGLAGTGVKIVATIHDDVSSSRLLRQIKSMADTARGELWDVMVVSQDLVRDTDGKQKLKASIERFTV